MANEGRREETIRLAQAICDIDAVLKMLEIEPHLAIPRRTLTAAVENCRAVKEIIRSAEWRRYMPSSEAIRRATEFAGEMQMRGLTLAQSIQVLAGEFDAIAAAERNACLGAIDAARLAIPKPITESEFSFANGGLHVAEDSQRAILSRTGCPKADA